MLQFGLSFADLYSVNGISKLHCAFSRFCEEEKHRFQSFQETLLNQALILEQFLLRLFGVEKEYERLTACHRDAALSYEVKRNFIQKGIRGKTFQIHDAESTLKAVLNTAVITEEIYTGAVLEWLQNRDLNRENLNLALQYAEDQIASGSKKALFCIPKILDKNNLVNAQRHCHQGLRVMGAKECEPRYGFDLTDKGIGVEHALHQAHYCIYCHRRDKDSCRTGLKNTKASKSLSNHNGGEGNRENLLGGCPLDQKISEMNALKAQGRDLAALAVIAIDNPLCAATGHRICNDCTRSCVYQKQDPVDIPGVESNILANVLWLPYGFEIYSLLTRWNPLGNLELKPDNGGRVLVVGMGPAGFSLAYYLLNQGFTVVGIDGLRISPLSDELVCSGSNYDRPNQAFKPIREVKSIYENLSDREVGGFGGVAEYGITSRWDKNYLQIIRIILQRYQRFILKGATSLGGNISVVQALEGFDHVALATGAGKPRVPNIRNFFLAGVRIAADFLMSLHLNTPYRSQSVSDMQLVMPIVVIGGGLTAVDAATEALAYYPLQVEKFQSRYQVLDDAARKQLWDSWSSDEQETAKAFLEHANLFKALKSDARALMEQMKRLGGVKLIYRKKMVDSPAYQLNHQELTKALAEGVELVESLEAREFLGSSRVRGVRCFDIESGAERTLAAGSVLVAIGTESKVPNKYLKSGMVSIFGDADPRYAGSVVKAIASAKDGYRKVVEAARAHRDAPRSDKAAASIFCHGQNGDAIVLNSAKFLAGLDYLLSPQLLEVKILASNILELVVRAPMAAKNFRPGQFYRFQAPGIEPIALTGASVQGEVISLIILEMGGSSSLCRYLKPGAAISLMGPSGQPSYIPSGKQVLLIGGGLGNAVLFSIGKAMRAQGCKVWYCAGYKKLEDRFKVEELEAAADVVIWSCESGVMTTNRAQDCSFQGNVIEALINCSNLSKNIIKPSTIDHLVVIGSNSMMAACAQAFEPYRGVLRHLLNSQYQAIVALNSPMQCMLQGICAQCIQSLRHPNQRDPQVIFSCICQDQPIEYVDFDCLRNRLAQNSASEKLTHAFLSRDDKRTLPISGA